jgi:ubiquitin-protein ligase
MTGLCKEDSDTVSQSGDHIIEISIPFGFPHFPPSCKPKSKTFHPDFDPAAICLGDFWNQDSTLADLVVYIGRMINGEMYSTRNAFNEEAADYYSSHREVFPFAPISWGEEDSRLAETRAGAVDTLEEEDLLPDFNFFALEDREPKNGAAAKNREEQPLHDENIHDRLFLLEGQKKFYQLLEVAASCSLPAEELDQIVQNCRFQISKAEELYDAAQRKEGQGKGAEALQLFADAGNTVSDFPAIHSDIQRVTRTFLTPKAGFQESEAEWPPDSAGASEETDRPRQSVAPERGRDSFFTESKKKSKTPLLLVILLLCLVAGISGFIWYSSTRDLAQAELAYARCSSALEDNRFNDAKNLCELALKTADRVKFLEKERTWQIQAGAEELLKSEKLIQGLAGKTYIDGRYLLSRDAQLLGELNQQLLDANALYLAEKWQDAAKLYGKLELQAKKSGLFDEATLEDISSKRLTAEFKVSFDSALVAMALVAMQKGQWEVAVAELIKAQEILTNIPETERARYSEELQYALEKCQFEDFKVQGDTFYSKREWKNALTSYNFALSNAESDSLLPPESVAEVRSSKHRVELYLAIDEGNQAFAERRWDDAIIAYNKAFLLLTNHQDVFDPADSKLHKEKLERILLQASIIRDRQIARVELKEKKLQEVRNSYRQILANIDASRFAGEEEFATTRKEIEAALKSVEEGIYLAEKEAYLIQNYQQLFMVNYPTAIQENLEKPLVSFVRQTSDTLVFKMQCTETGRGRPLSLVMYYAYNKNNGRWSLHSEKE